MNINYKQPQFELFPGQSTVGDDVTKPRFFLANLTLTIENLVVLGILCIMLAVFAFSLGVERGKYVMAAQLKEKAQTKPLMSDPALANVGEGAGLKSEVEASAASDAAQNLPIQTVKPVDSAVVVGQKSQKTDSDFKYTVQVASYVDEKFARRVADDLSKKGFQTMIMQKGKYVILCIGRFSKKQEALAMTTKLKPKYKDCLIRSM